jgi:hypothetical protein
MATNDESGGTPAGGAGPAAASDKDGKGRGVADYLQAPRKKRRSYVLVACGQHISQELQAGIDQFLKSQFKNYAISHPKTPEELVKQLARQVVLLVYDDEFSTDAAAEEALQVVIEMKKKKGATAVPVLFLTRDPKRLIDAYSKVLLPYQEVDDYIDYERLTPAHVYSKIRACLSTTSNRRRSRRYKVDLPIAYFVLDKDAFFPGHLVDLSIHGGLLKSDDKSNFRVGEQMKLHIPISEYLVPTEGDYLKLSARVRRVFIGGSQAGISFEHMTDKQLLTLTRFLTEMVNAQNARRLQAMRAKNAR